MENQIENDIEEVVEDGIGEIEVCPLEEMKVGSLGDGRWFDLEKSEKFDEERYWDGHNWVSCPTKSQWEHETLYRTRKGSWVKCYWKNYPSEDVWELIDASEASRWLIENGHSSQMKRLGFEEVFHKNEV